MLCDGRVVCGCADPYGKRVLGDTRTTSLHDIWTGPTISALREDLNWFEKLPLFGQRIIVTRAEEQAGESAERPNTTRSITTADWRTA